MLFTLFLMTRKGYSVLKNIIKKRLAGEIDFVVIGHDNNVEKDFADEIIETCKQHKIEYYQKEDDFEMKSKYAIAVSWRWIIRETKDTKLIILHDSLLPKYRGFAPLVNALINKEKNIGVTAIFASENYDRGNIIYKSSTKIDYPIKINEAIQKIIPKYCELIEKIFRMVQQGKKLPSKPQNENEASYSLWRDEHDYLIDWNQNANDIKRFIDAVGFPYKGATSFINGKKIRINDAEVYPDKNIENRDYGKVIFFEKDYPVIVCGKGLLKIIDAIYEDNGKSIIPLKKFRVRFNGK